VRPVLCLVTDRARCGGEDRLVAFVAAAALAGVHLVQLREKDLEGRALQQLAARCVEAVRGTRARILVNDRVDVALAAGAHGVHLPSTGVPASRIRAHVPLGFLIGRSVHSEAEAMRAVAAGGLDYLVFGAVFATASKPGVEPAGIDALRAVVTAAPLPVLAIGGVTIEVLPEVARSGAAGIAAIGLFTSGLPTRAAWLQTVVAKAALAFDTPGGVP
jgi:thiamine-phosphate pyrophosphorylase